MTTEGQVVFEYCGKARANVHEHHAETFASMLPFVTADGTVLVVFWVLKVPVEDGQKEGKVQERV